MSRPSSNHDGQRYEEDPFESSGFSLPLFNPHQSTGPSYRAGVSDGRLPHLPPLPSSSHVQRHSMTYGSDPNSPFNSSTAIAPNSSGLPRSQHRQQESITSTLPFTSVPYPQSAQHASQADELMPPATSSASFGSLARSASLGARKKDPYSYSSDDVESGLGSMDVRGESSSGWPGYGGARPVAQTYAPPPQLRDVTMSPSKPDAGSYMNPPPVPAYALTRPPPVRNDSSRSSPSRPMYANGQGGSLLNPYLPREPDPGLSLTVNDGQWADYRRPQIGLRVATSVSNSDQLSPFSRPETMGNSPQSPLLSPYELPPSAPSQPSSPNLAAQPRWVPENMSISPPRGYRSQSSNQIYPASQPVTPATKGYDVGPPRVTMPGRESSGRGVSKQGFREVNAWKDLVAVVNNEPNGRRADPNLPGKYLSVSYLTTLS